MQARLRLDPSPWPRTFPYALTIQLPAQENQTAFNLRRWGELQWDQDLARLPYMVVSGQTQDPIDGVSMKYSFENRQAKGNKGAQYFEIMGSRGVYRDDWRLSVWGPRTPWVADVSGLADWKA